MLIVLPTFYVSNDSLESEEEEEEGDVIIRKHDDLITDLLAVGS